MKDKEVYLNELKSLKENISHKIMEAIHDLEAKNLKKIEKKIKKASQKIALGIIKATLKNENKFSSKSALSFSNLAPLKKIKVKNLKKNPGPGSSKPVVTNSLLRPKRGRPFLASPINSDTPIPKLKNQKSPIKEVSDRNSGKYKSNEVSLNSLDSNLPISNETTGKPFENKKLIKKSLENKNSKKIELSTKKKEPSMAKFIANSPERADKLISTPNKSKIESISKRGRPFKSSASPTKLLPNSADNSLRPQIKKRTKNPSKPIPSKIIEEKVENLDKSQINPEA